MKIILSILISAIIFGGVFVWKEYNSSKEEVVREEVKKNKLTGDIEIDCKISGGEWQTITSCAPPPSCERQLENEGMQGHIDYTCSLEESYREQCTCGEKFCWDGKSCVDYNNWKSDRQK
ncbi:MAG: hypothetical protein HOE19_03215 [Candidatus Komeilibacteria bacterium]|jgi:hypothetical protein|nr:hypothetical protein [Candidatus Komeilibacteria bacterium]MBT4447687.1 hypothetical protein [Candidatus Komeilibacteria bacterium]